MPQAHLRPGHFWIAELDKGALRGVIEREFQKNQSVEGISFTRGDLCVKLKRWLHRDPTDPNGLTFIEFRWKKDDPRIINATELRYISVNLKKVVPPALQTKRNPTRGTALLGVAGVAGGVRAALGLAGGRTASASTHGEASAASPPEPKGTKWHLSNLEDSKIRRPCWSAMPSAA